MEREHFESHAFVWTLICRIHVVLYALLSLLSGGECKSYLCEGSFNL